MAVLHSLDGALSMRASVTSAGTELEWRTNKGGWTVVACGKLKVRKLAARKT